MMAEYIDRQILVNIRIPKEQQKPGEWDMFELITSTYYGKQYYFLEGNGIVYSRASQKVMTMEDAIDEFLRQIGDDGNE